MWPRRLAGVGQWRERETQNASPKASAKGEIAGTDRAAFYSHRAAVWHLS